MITKNKWSAQRALQQRAHEYENFDEIEIEYCNGIIEVLKNFIQKYLLCCQNPSVFEFCHCGHQCICRNGLKKVRLIEKNV